MSLDTIALRACVSLVLGVFSDHPLVWYFTIKPVLFRSHLTDIDELLRAMCRRVLLPLRELKHVRNSVWKC